MDHLKTFSGATEAEIWQQITADMATQTEMLEYAAHVNQNGRDIFIDVEIDLGGGFESGYENTSFAAPLLNHTDLRFQLYHQNWLSTIGKMLGVEDVVLGYPELDEAFIIKTNQPDALQVLFANENLRRILLKYPNAELKLEADFATGDSPVSLSFVTDTAYTNPADLQEIYQLMFGALEYIDPVA